MTCRDDAVGVLRVFILEDFLTARFGEQGERNVIDDYLRRRGWRESVPARRYLEALRDSTVSLYEVVDIVPGRSMSVRDLIHGGEPVQVEERRGSQGAALRDRLAARIVAVHGRHRFTGAVLRYPHALSQRLLEVLEKMAGEMQGAIRAEADEGYEAAPVTRAVAREVMVRTPLFPRILSQLWMVDAVARARAPGPVLRNTDDEAVELCEVRFPLTADVARVGEVLDGVEAFEREEGGEPRWRWLAPGSPMQRAARHRGKRPTADSSQSDTGTTLLGDVAVRKGMLVLSVNSQARAERGRELLASRLGALVGPALIAHQVPERTMAARSEHSPEEPEIPPEDVVQVMHSYLDDHYRRTLDDPLPMLDGKTLREAAATRTGRVRVVNWLKELENTEHRRAVEQGHRPYDTAWLWRALGIEAPR